MLYCMITELLDCGSLPNPPNGQVVVTGTFEGSTAFYSCDFGLVLEGESVRICQSNGNWSDREPACVGKLQNFHVENVACGKELDSFSCLYKRV